MKAFQVSGTFTMGKTRDQPFAKQFAAKDEADAREQCFSIIGSEHGAKRLWVKIATVEEIAPDADVDVVVARRVEKA